MFSYIPLRARGNFTASLPRKGKNGMEQKAGKKESEEAEPEF